MWESKWAVEEHCLRQHLGHQHAQGGAVQQEYKHKQSIYSACQSVSFFVSNKVYGPSIGSCFGLFFAYIFFQVQNLA